MRPEDLAAVQVDLVARWQLLGLGYSEDAARWWARDLRSVFPGVHVIGHAPVTEIQLLRAATLTTPSTWLAGTSAAVAHELLPPRSAPGSEITVVRPGASGLERPRGLVVRYSRTLAGNVGVRTGIPMTSVERTVIDVWPLLRDDRARHRLVREALRTGATDVPRLLAAIRRHRGARGVAGLRAFASRYSDLPFHRCRSDAEAYALTVLDEAGVEIPLVNVRIAGEEADFVWMGPRRILEIDGPQWHRFADVDARKDASWRRAGFSVDRVPSPTVYADPASLLRLALPTR